MKKQLSLLLAVVMSLLLVSCGSSPSSEDNKLDKSAEFSRGIIEGDVYKNNFLGFEFTKPESWIYSTDEEIAALLNMSIDAFLDENFKKVLETNQTVYDMMVVDTITRSNIGVSYENLLMASASNITEKQYIEVLKNQLSSISGMTVSFPEEYETAMLGKTEFTKLVCTVNTQGVSMKQVYYLCKLNGFMCNVILTIPSGYTVEQIEAMFK